MDKRHEKKRRPLAAPAGWLAAGILLLAAVLPYLNSLWGSFHFDDSAIIERNESIRTLEGVLAARPVNRLVAFLTYFVNYKLHGLDWMPGWHAVNIGLHAGCVLTLYAVLRRLPRGAGPEGNILRQGQDAPRSVPPELPTHGRDAHAARAAAMVPESLPFYAALLFAVHPLASEPVNYIQARNVLLYTLFALLGLLAAVSAHRAKSWPGRLVLLALMAGAWVGAALSKEVGLFFAPAVAGLYGAVFVLPQVVRKGRLWLVGTLAAAAMLVAVGVLWLRHSGAWDDILFRLKPSSSREEGSAFFWSHLWGQVTIFWQYIYLACVPLPGNLTADHYVRPYWFGVGHEPPYALGKDSVLLSLLALAALAGVAVWQWRRRPQLTFLLLLLPLGLGPYFIMTTAEMMVEYRCYLSLAAFCAVAAWGLVWLALRGEKAWRWTMVGGLCLALATCTLIRNNAWRTGISLWEDAVEKAPRKARAVNGLAWALATDKDHPDPKRALELALRSFDERYVDVWRGNLAMLDTLAEAYYANGMYDEAVECEGSIIKEIESGRGQGHEDFYWQQYQKYVAARDAKRKRSESGPTSGPAATTTASGSG